jgi:hypothetical protein
MVVHHTDAGNEFSYDRNAAFGRLEKVLKIARDNGWIVVDMLKDWNRIFPESGK